MGVSSKQILRKVVKKRSANRKKKLTYENIFFLPFKKLGNTCFNYTRHQKELNFKNSKKFCPVEISGSDNCSNSSTPQQLEKDLPGTLRQLVGIQIMEWSNSS